MEQFNLFSVNKNQPLLLHKLMKVRLEPYCNNLQNNNEDDWILAESK